MEKQEKETRILRMLPPDESEVHVVVIKDDKGLRCWFCEDHAVAEALLERYCEEHLSELDPKATIQPERPDLIDAFFEAAKGKRAAAITRCSVVLGWEDLYEAAL